MNNKIKKALLLVLTISIFIIFLEIGTNVLFKEIFPLKNFTGYFKQSENILLGFELKPNFFDGDKILINGKITYKENELFIHTNSKGFRDYEHLYENTNNTFRIIVLGDSVTFGHNVKLENSYSKILEQILNNNSINQTYEVITLAVPGYDTFQETILLEQYGLEYNPDLLVIGYILNDAITEGKTILKSLGKKIYDKREKEIENIINQTFSCKIKSFIGRSNFMTKTNIRLFLNNIFSKQYFEYKSNMFLLTYKNKCTYKRTNYSFEKISELSNKHNFKVMLALFPLIQEFSSYNYLDIHTQIITDAEKNNFYTIDLFNSYKQYNYEDLALIGRDLGMGLVIHPNELGHKIAAQAIYNQLKEEELIT